MRIILAALLGGVVGAWAGLAVTGTAGMIALLAAVCAVLGSFLPVTARWLGRLRRRRPVS